MSIVLLVLLIGTLICYAKYLPSIEKFLSVRSWHGVGQKKLPQLKVAVDRSMSMKRKHVQIEFQTQIHNESFTILCDAILLLIILFGSTIVCYLPVYYVSFYLRRNSYNDRVTKTKDRLAINDTGDAN